MIVANVATHELPRPKPLSLFSNSKSFRDILDDMIRLSTKYKSESLYTFSLFGKDRENHTKKWPYNMVLLVDGNKN